LHTVFIFVSCEEKGCYRIVSLGHQNLDCRSYCGLSRRMQGKGGKMRDSGKRLGSVVAKILRQNWIENRAISGIVDKILYQNNLSFLQSFLHFLKAKYISNRPFA